MSEQQTNYDLLQLIREHDLKESPFLRIYSQQQTFCISSQPVKTVQLPFNQIFNETVNELNIMNRLIASNTRLTNSFLQNGRDIFTKKQMYFSNFLKMYPMIADALLSFPQEQYWILVYSIMTISNLILKLSINMAKISIISVGKLFTSSYFNLFIVSILFQKFLEFNLLLSKQKVTLKQNDRIYRSKQFPKISIVKLSKIKNNYDIKYIQKSQLLFHDKAANIQLIELFEQDSCKDNKRSTYSRHQSINLGEKLGLAAPFGFELYLFISEIIISKMNDFKPDIIVYMEDYSSDCVVIQPRVKGLIINQFSERVQNKIFIFKEFGMTSQMKNDAKTQLKMPNLPQISEQQKASLFISKEFVKYPEMKNQKINQLNMSNLQNSCYQKQSGIISKTINQTIDSPLTDEIQDCSVIQQKIKATSIQNNLIQRWINKSLIAENKQLYKLIRKQMITQEKIKIESPLLKKMQQMKKILLDQLTYMSLAMIQKSTFEEVLAQFRNYVFSSNFLKNFIQWIGRQHQYYSLNQKGYSQNCQMLRKRSQKLRGMLSLNNYYVPQFCSQAQKREGFPIFNLRTNSTEYLVEIKYQQLRPIMIQQQDEFYVAYQHQYIIIFVFRQSKYNVYIRHDSELYFTCQIDEIYTTDTLFLSQKNSSLIANQKYFYKSFGEYKNDSLSHDNSIYRICIQKPKQIRSCDWKSLGNTCLIYGKSKTFTKGVKIPLQFKRYGYGYTYNTSEGENKKPVNIVIFGGGYNYKIQNEQKINRCFYIIKDHSEDISKVGKTNGDLINQGQNLRNKAIIYPFVYGIPLEYEEDKQIAILNTNGILSNVNHFKKLFLSKVKINSFASPVDIGIISQAKLNYNKDANEVSLANKNTIISHLMGSWNKINRLDKRIVLYGQNQKIMVFKLQKTQQNNTDTFSMVNMVNQIIEDNDISVEFSNKVSIMPGLKKPGPQFPTPSSQPFIIQPQIIPCYSSQSKSKMQAQTGSGSFLKEHGKRKKAPRP